jgi:CBS domain-containing protein
MEIKDARASDVMTETVHTVEEDMDVREAITSFHELGISGAPVVNSSGSLVGVISQTDVVNYYLSRDEELVAETDFYQKTHLGSVTVPWRQGYEVMDTNTAFVRDLMSPASITAPEDSPVQELARTMVSKQIHRIIITRDEKVAGLVSALDLLKVFAR